MSKFSKTLEKFVHSIVPGAPLGPKGEELFRDAKVVKIDGTGEVTEDLNHNHVIVQDQVGSTIYLNCCPASLKLSKLTNCKIICGPVHTSTIVEHCRNCVFFLCGKQIRVSNSEFLDMYVRVEFRTTIRDSSNVRFAPYVWDEGRSPNMASLAHFHVSLERFDLIEDLNWLAFSTQSPNWTTIPETERNEFPEAELPEVEIPIDAKRGPNEEEDEVQEFPVPGVSYAKGGVTFNVRELAPNLDALDMLHFLNENSVLIWTRNATCPTHPNLELTPFLK